MVLFLNSKLGIDKNTSTAIYHFYEFLGTFSAIFGSFLCDGWWGPFDTMAWMTVLSVFGYFMFAVGTTNTTLLMPLL
jgi:dipeptide/tripeptide permease